MVKEAKYNIEETETNIGPWTNTLTATDYDVEVSIVADYDAINPRELFGHETTLVQVTDTREYNWGDKQQSVDLTVDVCDSCGKIVEDYSWTDDKAHCDNCGLVSYHERDIDFDEYIINKYNPAAYLTVEFAAHGCQESFSEGGTDGFIYLDKLGDMTYEQAILSLRGELQDFAAYVSGEVYSIWGGEDATWGFYSYEYAKEEALDMLDNLVNEAKDRKIAEAKLAWLADWQEPIMREAMEMGVVFI